MQSVLPQQTEQTKGHGNLPCPFVAIALPVCVAAAHNPGSYCSEFPFPVSSDAVVATLLKS